MCRRVLVLMSVCAVLAIAGNVSAELVGHWKFDEGSGRTAADSSGNGNDGTFVNNPTWITGVNGAALEFHGLGFVGGVADTSIAGTRPSWTSVVRSQSPSG